MSQFRGRRPPEAGNRAHIPRAIASREAMLWQGCRLSPSELERNPPRLVLGNSVARVSHSCHPTPHQPSYIRRQPQPIHPPHSRFSTVLQPPHFRAAPVGRQHTRAEGRTGSRLPTGAAVFLPSIGEARGYAPSRRPRTSVRLSESSTPIHPPTNPASFNTHHPANSTTHPLFNHAPTLLQTPRPIRPRGINSRKANPNSTAAMTKAT